MDRRRLTQRTILTLAIAALLAGVGASIHAATVLSSNLTATSSGVETLTGSSWLTASFGSGTTTMVLDSADRSAITG